MVPRVQGQRAQVGQLLARAAVVVPERYLAIKRLTVYYLLGAEPGRGLEVAAEVDRVRGGGGEGKLVLGGASVSAQTMCYLLVLLGGVVE